MKNLIINLSLALASIITVFCIGEVIYRLNHSNEIKKILNGRSPHDLITRQTNDDRIYELKPNTKITNKHGFRDVERSPKKAEGTYRIAVIGDSVSMQRDIPFESLYFRRLQTILDSETPGVNIEILNFGVTGYSTKQQVALLSKKVLDFVPDSILWQFHDNDSVDPTKANADGGMATYYSKPASYFLRFISVKIYDHKKMWFKWKNHLEGVPGELVDQLFNWDISGELFKKVADVCKEKGIPVFLFLYPSWPKGDDWKNYTERGFEIHKRMVERFESLGFTTLDLLPLLKNEKPGEFRISKNDSWHPNEKGHSWIARRLADWLERNIQPPYGRLDR